MALVGYTNAGKTTLFNALTGGEEYKADQLFATLDSVTRKNLSPGSRAILFTDTVGFISEIPTELIESFKTTLDDLRSADLLIHLIDVNDPEKDLKQKEVLRILKDLNVDDIPQLLVNNKVDNLPAGKQQELEFQNPGELYISAEKNIGIESLKEKIMEQTSNGLFKGWVSVSHTASATRAKLYEEGCVKDEISKESEWHLKLNVGNDFLTESINSSELKILFNEEQENLEAGKPVST